MRRRKEGIRISTVRRAHPRGDKVVLRSLTASHRRYQWRKFAPSWKQGPAKFLGWLITGHHSKASINTPLTITDNDDEEEGEGSATASIKEKINNLARTLYLLREYEAKFGMPSEGARRNRRGCWRSSARGCTRRACPSGCCGPS